MRVYDLETARETVLNRKTAAERRYPPSFIQAIEIPFGRGSSSVEALRQIITMIRREGDQAVVRWSKDVDEHHTHDLAILPIGSAAACESFSQQLMKCELVGLELLSAHTKVAIFRREENHD
jgi:histidinol dehydrogenase